MTDDYGLVDDGRPHLCVAPLELTVTKLAWELVQQQTSVFPRAYKVGGYPVRPVQLDDGVTVTRPLSANEFRAIVDNVLFCYRAGAKNEIKPCYPPMDLMAQMLNDPDAPLPNLRRIVTVPVFDRNGKLRRDGGYNAADGMLLLPELKTRPVSPNPTPAERGEAKRFLTDDLLGDFPFATEGDLASAVALLLLPFARELITGPTPLHFIEAPTPASGKGLLAWVSLLPCLGERGTNWSAFPDEEEELRKQITSFLLEARGAVLWDNLGRFLKSATLAKLLTDLEWSDRRLGSNSGVTIPVRTIWVMTGNNPQISDELIRRIVPIRLVPQLERPEERKGFRHNDLRTWAREERVVLIWAAHTLIQAWIAEGRPAPSEHTPPLGSFESYRAIIGGILHFAGFAGFLENRTDLQLYSDPDTEKWRAFVAAWGARFGNTPTKSVDLLPLALEAEITIRGESDKARLGSFTSQLGARRQRTFAGFRIETGHGRERRLWVAISAGSAVTPRDTVQGNGSGNGQHSLTLSVTPVAPCDTLSPSIVRENEIHIMGYAEVETMAHPDTRVTEQFGPGLDHDVPIGNEPEGD